VAEELVLNAFEHGGARSVIMQADAPDDPLQVIFEDDGASFDPSAPVAETARASHARGLGLNLVRAYTRSIAHERIGDRNRVVVLLVE